jgi:hypothetical protein
VDAIVGMIDERTKDLPAERPRERRKGFEALFSNGAVSAEREAGGYDLFDFAPTEYGDCGQGFRLNATMHSDRRRPPVPTKAAGVWLPA